MINNARDQAPPKPSLPALLTSYYSTHPLPIKNYCPSHGQIRCVLNDGFAGRVVDGGGRRRVMSAVQNDMAVGRRLVGWAAAAGGRRCGVGALAARFGAVKPG
jgi:hypothetical protein